MFWFLYKILPKLLALVFKSSSIIIKSPGLHNKASKPATNSKAWFSLSFSSCVTFSLAVIESLFSSPSLFQIVSVSFDASSNAFFKASSGVSVKYFFNILD